MEKAQTTDNAQTIRTLLEILAKLPPDILSALASSVAGGLMGGLIAIGLPSITGATAPAIAVGAHAYALGAGATAVAMEGGIAIAIGSGSSASAVGGVVVAIAPAVALGLGVGALIGLLSFLVYKYASGQAKDEHQKKKARNQGKYWFKNSFHYKATKNFR